MKYKVGSGLRFYTSCTKQPLPTNTHSERERRDALVLQLSSLKVFFYSKIVYLSPVLNYFPYNLFITAKFCTKQKLDL